MVLDTNRLRLQEAQRPALQGLANEWPLDVVLHVPVVVRQGQAEAAKEWAGDTLVAGALLVAMEAAYGCEQFRRKDQSVTHWKRSSHRSNFPSKPALADALPEHAGLVRAEPVFCHGKRWLTGAAGATQAG